MATADYIRTNERARAIGGDPQQIIIETEDRVAARIRAPRLVLSQSFGAVEM